MNVAWREFVSPQPVPTLGLSAHFPLRGCAQSWLRISALGLAPLGSEQRLPTPLPTLSKCPTGQRTHPSPLDSQTLPDPGSATINMALGLLLQGEEHAEGHTQRYTMHLSLREAASACSKHGPQCPHGALNPEPLRLEQNGRQSPQLASPHRRQGRLCLIGNSADEEGRPGAGQGVISRC